MKVLTLFSLLLLLVACNSEGTEADSANQQDSLATQPLGADAATAPESASSNSDPSGMEKVSETPNYSFRLESLGEDETGTPYTRVHVEYEEDGALVSKPILKIMGEVQELGESQYEQYKIPATAEQPHYGFWAGLGHAFYIDKPEDGPITIKETFQDEAAEATEHKVILTLQP